MKKYLSVLPLLALLTTQCRRDQTPAPTITQSQPFTLAAGQTTQIKLMPLATAFKATADTLRFTLNAINDSRCPANADCVRAGEATTKFTLTYYGASSAEQTLSTPSPDGKTRADSALVRVGTASFVVVLRSVQPFPGLGNGTKTATFVVK
jgi:hypothetical protein